LEGSVYKMTALVLNTKTFLQDLLVGWSLATGKIKDSYKKVSHIAERIGTEPKKNFDENKLDLYTLSNYENLLEQALDTNFINEKESNMLSQWNANPSEWS